MDRREKECGNMDRIDFAQDRQQWRDLMNPVINIQTLQNFGKFLRS
jgi:hypothetical protein